MSSDGRRYYIGVRQSKQRPLLDNYYGSYYDKTFRPNSKQILGLHNDRKDALLAEVYWHKIFNVKSNPLFVNQANQTSNKFDYDWTGKPYPQSAKDKISKKVKEYYKNNTHPFLNKKHTQESKQKMSHSLSGIKSPWYGKKHKESTKKKQSEAKKIKEIYTFFCCSTSESYEGTPHDFKLAFNLNEGSVSSLINYKIISAKGWIIL